MGESLVKDSRIFKSGKNAVFSLLNQIITLLIQFAVRTIFIKTLSAEFLGLNGLFSNILSVLSLAELGLGTAIVCNMYGPLAKKDEHAILVYFNAYRKIYTAVGLIIGAVGLCITPFLGFFVADADNISHLEFYYLLYLLDTVSSYFFAHYRSVFSADQKEYLNTIIKTVFLLVQTLLQIFVLIVLHDFFLFLSIKILCNFLSGFVTSLRVKKIYPYLKSKEKTSLKKRERKTLLDDSFGVLTTRIELVVLNSTDSILISSIFGSIITGYYSNYSLIIGAISTAAGLIFSATEASIGNYCNQKSPDKAKTLFSNISYIYYCIYGFCSICLVSLITPFIRTWLGNNYLLSYAILFVTVLNFYLSCSRQANLSFITVNHLSKKLTVKNIIEPIINLSVSILLAKTIGLVGVFVGTTVSLSLTSFWYEPFVLHKYYFKKGYSTYIVDYFVKLIIVCIGALLCFSLCNIIYCETIASLLICFVITIVLSCLFVSLPFIKSEPFRYLVSSIKNLHRHIRKRQYNE